MQKKPGGLLAARFHVVWSVEDGQQAIDSTLRLNPDVLVTDMSMPMLNGLQVASRLRDLGCPTKVIVVRIHHDDNFRKAAFLQGALGYVLKCRIDTDLIPAIEGAHEWTTTVQLASKGPSL
jgi:DNA-binding NarL/FixJ family response regulator